MGFFQDPPKAASDEELLRTAARALGSVRGRLVGPSQDGTAAAVAWLDVALTATQRAGLAIPRAPEPIPGQTELGDFLPTPPPGAAHSLRQ